MLFGIGPARSGRKFQLFQEGDQVDVAFLEDRALRQIHLIHHEIGLIEVEDIEPAANGGQFGQKAADQAIGFFPSRKSKLAGWICRFSIGASM